MERDGDGDLEKMLVFMEFQVEGSFVSEGSSVIKILMEKGS